MVHTQEYCDRKIVSFEEGVLVKVGQQNLPYFSKFVFDLYNFHYLKKYNWNASQEELYDMAIQDQDHIDDAIFFAYKNNQDELLGTIKLTPKQNDLVFPIEESFGIDIEQLILERKLKVKNIWHLGRLAINSYKVRDQQMRIQSREVMRLLLIAAFREVDQSEEALIIAEADQLIYKLFHEMGINMQIIGEAQGYLGSPTYPTIMTGEDIRLWLRKNPIIQESPLLSNA